MDLLHRIDGYLGLVVHRRSTLDDNRDEVLADMAKLRDLLAAGLPTVEVCDGFVKFPGNLAVGILEDLPPNGTYHLMRSEQEAS